MAILDNLPTSAVEEMKSRLMMEGIFNRESELLELRLRIKGLAEDCGNYFSQLSIPLRYLDSDDCEAPINIASMLTSARINGFANFKKIHKDLSALSVEMFNISKEMEELINERANR